MNLSDEKPKEISFIFSDLDQTLLVDNHISKDNIDITHQFLSHPDRHMALASARPTRSIELIAKDAGFEKYLGKNLHIAGYNGGMTYFQQELILDQSMPQDEANTLVLNSIRHNVPSVFFTDKGIIANNDDEWSQWYFAVTGYKNAGVVGDFSDILNPTTQVYIAEFHRCSPEEEFRSTMGISLDTMNYASFNTKLFNPPSDPDIVHVSSKRTDKSHALSMYTTCLRISQQNVLVIGDAFNDIAALTTPDVVPVTFEDAFPNTIRAVKDVSGYIAPPAAKDGFYHAIKSLVRM